MTLRSVPLLLLIFLMTFVIHEGAHWAMGEALGYDMEVSINRAGPVSAEPTPFHAMLISAAGPVVTFLQAVIALILIGRTQAVFWFLTLFSAFFMRVMAFGVSFLNYNDEARISLFLGWHWWLLPLLVVSTLLLLTIQGSRKLGLGWKSWGLGWIVLSFGAAGIIFSEPYWPVLS